MTHAGSRPRNHVAAHPIISAAIGILFVVLIFFILFSPLYSTVTPKIGSWPFFYFYLLVSMPVTSVLLWIITRLQKRLGRSGGTGPAEQPPSTASGSGALS
jgi:predicted ABC-type exoprotein transport system permease subunit